MQGLKILGFLWVMVFGISSLPAQNLYAFISADTLDETIGESVKKDLENFKDLMTRVAGYTGMTLKLTTVEGADFTHNKMTRAIQSLNPGTNDTVVFYNSSHGFRMKNTGTKWPLIYAPDGDGLDEYWVYQTLAAKKPRLLIVLADVCNVVADEGEPVPNVVPRTVSSAEKQNYTTLFVKSKGVILASSSKPGQASLAYEQGGAFTLNFMTALKSAARSSAVPLWSDIMKASMKSIMPGTDSQQDPQHEMLAFTEGAKLQSATTATTGTTGTTSTGTTNTGSTSTTTTATTGTSTTNTITNTNTGTATTGTTSTGNTTTGSNGTRPNNTNTATPTPSKLQTFSFQGGKLEEKGSKAWKLTLDGRTFNLKEYERTKDNIYLQSDKKKLYFALDLKEKALYFYDWDIDDWDLLVDGLK